MKAVKWLDKHLEEMILIVLLVMIVVVMLYQIVRRYVFNSSLTWSEEFCRYAFVWFIFIALPYSIRLGSELRMDAILSQLPEKAQNTAKIALNVISLCLAGFLFYNSIIAVQEAVLIGEKTPGLHMPKEWLYVSMVIGFGLAVIRYLQVLYRMITGKNGKEETT